MLTFRKLPNAYALGPYVLKHRGGLTVRLGPWLMCLSTSRRGTGSWLRLRL
jgi:hypothetical protein